jgi:hypothetical protein
MKKYLLSIFVVLGLAATTVSAEAATCTYTGPAGGDWHTAGNWDCTAVPGSTDSAILPAGVSVSGTTAALNPGDLTVGTGAVLDIMGQDLTVATGATTNAGTIQSSGDLTFQAVDNSGVIFSTGFHPVDFLGAVVNSGSIETDTNGTVAAFHSAWDNTGGAFDGQFVLRFVGDTDQTVPSNVSSVYGFSMEKADSSTLALQGNLETTGNNSGLVLVGAGPATLDLGGFTVTNRGNTFSLYGENSITNGAVTLNPTLGTATVNFSGLGDVDIDLTVDATGSVTLASSPAAGTFILLGNLTVISGTIDFPSNEQFYIHGTTDNAGTINNTGHSEFTGTVTNTGTIGSSGTGLLTFYGHLDNQGALALGSAYVDFWDTWDNAAGTINPEARVEILGSADMTLPSGITIGYLNVSKFSATAKSILSGDVTVDGTVLLQGGILDLDGNTIYTRQWSVSYGSLEANLGTVEITGSGSASVIDEEPDFYNLRINATSPTDQKGLNGDIGVAGILEIVSGILKTNDHTITVKGTGTGGSLPFTGATADFQAGAGIVRFTGEDTSSGTSTDLENFNYNDLELQGSGIAYGLISSTDLAGEFTLTAGNTLNVGNRQLTVPGAFNNAGVISLDVAGGGSIIHPTESLAITDEAGAEAATVNAGGNTLFVTLHDGNRNLDGTALETVTVTVSTDAAAGSDLETLTLTETGPATGIFRNLVGLRVAHIIGSATHESTRLELTGSGVVTASYVDAQDASDTASDTAAASVTPIAAPVPGSSGGGGGGSLLPVVPTYQTYTYGGSGTDGVLVGATSTLMEPHTLVKLPDDGNPNTQSDSAVYYIGTDGMRHAFPNDKVYFTWYASFDGIQIIGQEQMALIPLGKNVTYKPGVKLVKFMTDPKVYAVASGATLRWVTTEEVAVELYGNDWAKMVDDISDAFYENYAFGTEIAIASEYDPAAMRAAAQYPSNSFSAEDVF